MPLPQLRLVNAAYHHGAMKAGASAMHGWARFNDAALAGRFSEVMLSQQWFVTVYPQPQLDGTNVIAVDWTCHRMPNGNVTPIRSEAKSNAK